MKFQGLIFLNVSATDFSYVLVDEDEDDFSENSIKKYYW